MRVLVIGSGGREHALAWRLTRDPDVTEVLAAPGNPGIAALARCLPVDLGQPADVLALAVREQVDLTVVGPEAPLEKGLADQFRAQGLPIVGPSARGAALECSKAYAKDFMSRHGVPTARFEVCDDPETALRAVSGATFGFPVVVKADGLAAGKGVIIAQTRQDAEDAVRAVMVSKQFGAAGSRLVIEECLTGPEASLFVLCDGDRALLLGTAQDYKRISDGDVGPNTGGMGAIAPSPLVDSVMASAVMRDVVERVLAGCRKDEDPYRGFLYVSLMLTPSGPKVIEFNVRFGDPEAQVVMPRLEGPFARVLLASATTGLNGLSLGEHPDRVVGVVMASRGYPGAVDTGMVITGFDRAAEKGGVVFHAGTRDDNGRVVTAGGRVLTVVGRGATYSDARDIAYRAAAEIRFDGQQQRSDIGLGAAVHAN